MLREEDTVSEDQHYDIQCIFGNFFCAKVNLDEVQGIFAEDNAELKSLLEKYSVDSVERCARWVFES